MNLEKVPELWAGFDFDIIRGNILFSDIVTTLRKRYKIEKKKKAYLFTIELKKRIDNLKYKEENFCCVEIEGTDFVIQSCDGIIKEDTYDIVCFTIDDKVFYAVFTEDFDKFKDIYRTKKIEHKLGLYKITHTALGSYMERLNITNVTRPILNNDLFSDITLEINQFTKKRDVYIENQLDYKRGILLYGLPGDGKTCFIKHLLKDLKAISIICETKKDNDIDFVYDFMNNKILKDYLKIIVLEDIDGVEEYERSKILNLIDGLLPLDNVIFIATSNYPEQLDHAFTNRPSRFDSLYEIKSPDENSRKKLLQGFFPDLTEEELNVVVKESDNFRGAHFKEMFLLTKIFDSTPLEAAQRLKNKFKDFSEFTKGKQKYMG